MNPEIKYRAWIRKEKRIAFVGTIWWNYEDGPKIINVDGRNYSLSEIILMQFTGLKDKDGEEIHEGDIVNVTAFDPHVVRYADGAFWFASAKYPNSVPWVGMYNMNPKAGYTNDGKGLEVEVIGNIYENPRLLK